MRGRFRSAIMATTVVALLMGGVTVHGAGASVQFKICPEAAARIADPGQTSLTYVIPDYRVALTDAHAAGRVPVRDMLTQPGVSFVKADGLPIGPAGISMMEATIGEDFPGQRFMLLPGDNEILVCPWHTIQ